MLPVVPPAPAPVVPSPIAVPYGTEHIEAILDVGVEALKNYKSILPADSTMSKVSKFFPALMKLIAALDGIAKAGPEFKDLDDKELEALSAKYLPQIGVDGKTGIYVKEGMNILVSGYKIFKAK